MGDPLAEPLTLPCGAVLPNRLCKAAMTEGLADALGRATPALCRLYSSWGGSGCGLLLTGNVQVDRRFVERPGNVAVDLEAPEEGSLPSLKRWAAAAKGGGAMCWVQLGHAGRQCHVMVNKFGVAPSDVPVKGAGGFLQPSWPPRALSAEECGEVARRFAYAARQCKLAGFDGVQLHAAHGYLLSSFLNPLANRRHDRYGGPLQGRCLLLLECVRAVRSACGPRFPVGVKLNSSDFQKGGLTVAEAAEAATLLEREGVDLIEVSGGSYENPALLGGEQVLSSNHVREAYFMEACQAIARAVKQCPLMLTGGMRSRAVMEEALRKGAASVVGVGRPMCAAPHCVKRLLARELDCLPRFENEFKLPLPLRWLSHGPLASRWGRMVAHGTAQMWYYRMIIILGDSSDSNDSGLEHVETQWRSYSPLFAFIFMERYQRRKARALQGLEGKTKGLVLNREEKGMAEPLRLLLGACIMAINVCFLAGWSVVRLAGPLVILTVGFCILQRMDLL